MSFLKKMFNSPKPDNTRYENFWTWFASNQQTFFNVVKQRGDIERDFFDKLTPKINSVRNGFFFVTGMCSDEVAELVITADGAIANFVFVEEFISSAPDLPNWKFTALKPALDFQDDWSIDMGDYQFNTAKIKFYSNEHKNYPDEIDISIVHEDMNETNKEAISRGVFIFLDNYLGELGFAVSIDNLQVIGPKDAEKELVPVTKLKDFLVWREKEFVEKYEGTRYSTENDTYSVLKAEPEDGGLLIAVVNTELLKWERKASHPWILAIEINFPSARDHGMPDQPTMNKMDAFEDQLNEELKNAEGYLNVCRETYSNTRIIYFACKEFRYPSKVLDRMVVEWAGDLKIKFEIYKDKYWQTFTRFEPPL
jgi:hypothetical protein